MIHKMYLQEMKEESVVCIWILTLVLKSSKELLIYLWLKSELSTEKTIDLLSQMILCTSQEEVLMSYYQAEWLEVLEYSTHKY